MGGGIAGKTVNARRDRGKCDIAKCLRAGDADAGAIAFRQNLPLAGGPTPPDRAYRMDDMRGRQTVSTGEPGLSRRASPQLSAFGQKLWPGRPMDGTVNPAP